MDSICYYLQLLLQCDVQFSNNKDDAAFIGLASNTIYLTQKDANKGVFPTSSIHEAMSVNKKIK